MDVLKWLTPPQFESKSQNHRARQLYYFIVLGFGFELALALFVPIIYPNSSGLAWLVLGVVGFLTFAAFWLMQRKMLNGASLFLCVLYGLAAWGSSLISNGLNNFSLALYTLVILMAGVLVSAQASVVFAFLGTAGLFALQFTELAGVFQIPQTPFSDTLTIVTLAAVYLISAFLFTRFANDTKTALQRATQNEVNLQSAKADLETRQTILEKQAQHHTTLLQNSLEINQMISRLMDVDQIGEEVVHKLVKLFTFEFAAIYLVDEAERWAILSYVTGNTNALIRNDPQQIDLQQVNAITNALRSRRIQITTPLSTITQAAIRQLPTDVRVEIVIPLMSRGKTLGVITLQSTQAFTPSRQELDILESVANQVATAFENARLLKETQQQLQEINRLNQFYLQTTWRALLTQQTPAYQFSAGMVTEQSTPNNIALAIAKETHKIQIIDKDGVPTLIAPIIFQEQVLGALELTAPNRNWTSDEIVMIEAVLNQTALSLENTRLILETRSRAEQEKMIGEISARMRETLDLETILQTSVQEMRQNLRLSEVEIRLIPPSPGETGPLPVSTPGE